MNLNLNVKDIKRLLKESMFEAGLGPVAPPKGLGGKVSPPKGLSGKVGAPKGAVNSLAAAKKGSGKFHPECKKVYYKIDTANQTENLICEFDWLPQQITTNLAQIFNARFPGIVNCYLDDKNPRIEKYAKENPSGKTQMPPVLVISVDKDKENEFSAVVKKWFVPLCKGYANNAPIDWHDLENIPHDYEMLLQGACNAGDEERAQKKMAQTWSEMLQRLNDPSIYAQLKKVTGIFVAPQATTNLNDPNLDIVAGYMLSPFNKMQVLLQLPNATYVTQEITWDKYYDREVIDPSQYAIIRKPVNNWKFKKVSEQILVQAVLTCTHQRFASWHDFVDRAKPDIAQKLAIMFEANKHMPQTEWMSVKVYDISNTRLKNGVSNDKWSEKAGFSDNLQGIPNQAYINKYAPFNAVPGTILPPTRYNYDDDDLYLIDGYLKTVAYDAQMAYTPKDAGNGLNKSGRSIADNIVRKAFAYGKARASVDAGLTSPQRQDAFAKAVAIIIAYDYDLFDKSVEAKQYWDELKNGDPAKETDFDTAIANANKPASILFAKIHNNVIKNHIDTHAKRRTALAANAQNIPAPQAGDLTPSSTTPVTSQPAAPAPSAQPAASQPAAPDPSQLSNKQKAALEEEFFRLFDKLEVL